MTRCGLPIRCWVFPGNTVDATTVTQIRKDLRGWSLTRCIFVGDAGMVSEENLKQLSLGGGRYILGMPLRREREVQEIVGRAGRYSRVKGPAGREDRDNLRVKEVWSPSKDAGERRRRYVMCYNPQEAKRTSERRNEKLRDLEEQLKRLDSRYRPR